MVCVACTADVPDEDLFCENCGVPLSAPQEQVAGCSCGAPVGETDEDGYCLQCGRRVLRPASDHMEEALSSGFAAVSDRGLRHERNEDRFALVGADQGLALVVCDGVSSTSHPEVASSTVAEAVSRALGQVLRSGEVIDAEWALIEALAAGKEELAGQTEAGQGEAAASTTAVAALVVDDEITVAWVGDSRAYWVDATGARALTRDHSWMNLVLEEGTMTQEEAQASPQAHAITRWIGVDAEGASTPELAHHRIQGSGTLLLCTDGLWNYAAEDDAIARLLEGGEDEKALDLARRLAQFANDQGGRDNVTVAVLRMRRGPEATESEALATSVEPQGAP